MTFSVDPRVVLRILATAALVYLFLAVALRLLGKRTLSKWNAFDFVVTVALGSVLGSVVVSGSISLVEGVVALGALLALQYVVTLASARFQWVDHTVKAQPTLLLHRGELRPGTMRRERVPKAEVLAALRSEGIVDLADVEAVVLETDGSFSVLRRQPGRALTTLEDVVGHPAGDGGPPPGPDA